MDARKFNLTPKEAVALQKQLREQVVLTPFTKKITYIAGCDVSMNLYSKTVYAGFVILSYPDLIMVDHAVVQDETKFPYIPGLLSFREIPSLLKAWKKLKIIPDLICVDGVGIAHPRRLGIATHLGLALDIPTIGIAKSILTGTHEPLGFEQGASIELFDIKNPKEVLGVVLRTKKNVKPVYVSPGYKITVKDAERIVRSCIGKYRIPEPTRLAHECVNEYRRKNLPSL